MPQGKYLSLTTTLQNTAYYLHIACSEDPYWHRKNLLRKKKKRKKENKSLREQLQKKEKWESLTTVTE